VNVHIQLEELSKLHTACSFRFKEKENHLSDAALYIKKERIQMLEMI